jgi:hypothetical protein
MNDGELAANQYDAMAADYSADNEDGPFNNYYERPATVALLADVSGKRVLEVGCGLAATPHGHDVCDFQFWISDRTTGRTRPRSRTGKA